jgi:hypothetical protein
VAKSIAVLLLLVAASCAHSAPRQPASQPQAETQPATPEPAATPVAPAMPVAPAAPQPATAAASAPSETTPTPAPQVAGNASPPLVARPPAATAAAPKPNPAASPVAAPKPGAPRVGAAPPPAAASSVAPPTPVASPTLDLNALKEQLKETKAIGFFTKVSLKNQVDDLMKQLREYYQGKTKLSLKQLRQSYDLLLMKVLSLLQDTDKKLASAIVSSREAIWGFLSDQKKFDALEI